MKIAMLSLLFLSAMPCIFLDYEAFYHVKFIYDGDTILLENGHKVRYVGINSPEINYHGQKMEFMALKAKEYNGNLLKGKRVRLEFDKENKDKHGRLLAFVFVENGEMVNKKLVERGLATVMTIRPNLKYRSVFLKCQRKAMKNRIGIWGRQSLCDERIYIGNANSFRFHRPGCSFGRRVSDENRILFKTPYEAFWEGFSPCKRCVPCSRWQETRLRGLVPLSLVFPKKRLFHNGLVIGPYDVPAGEDSLQFRRIFRIDDRQD
jgi:endonuclease YncB( thermonuclease family)